MRKNLFQDKIKIAGKILLISSLFFAFLVFYTSCSRGQQAASSGKIQLSYLTWNGSGQREADERIVAAFNERHSDVFLKSEFVQYNNFDSKINTLVAGGLTPDVFYLQEYNVYDWANKGIIEDIRPYFEKTSDSFSTDMFVSGAIFENNGKIWGVTPGVQIILLYFNKEVFRSVGVEFPSQDPLNPWTWDEFVAAAKAISVDINGRRPGDAGFDYTAVRTYGVMLPATLWLPIMPLLYSNNASYGSADGMNYTLDQAEGVQVVQALADLSLVHQVAPPPVANSALPATVQALINGQTAMFFGGQWEVSAFGEEGFADYGIAPLPMFKRPANISWGAGVVLSATSKHKDEAWDFLYSYINPQASLQQLKDGSNMPNMTAWYTDQALLQSWTDNPRHTQDFLDVVPTIMTEVAQVPENISLKNFGTIVSNILMPALDEVWIGETSAQEALSAVRAQVQRYFIGSWVN